MKNDGKTDRIREFFKNNPDEELTRADFMIKFDIDNRSTADSYIERLKKEGLIESLCIVRGKK